jgi:aconitate decarboxylase
MPKAAQKPLTRMMANYIRTVRYGDIPSRVLDPLRQSISDGIGCALKGSTTDLTRVLSGYVESWSTKGEATIWGTALKASAPFAAMVNCASTHAWDYDDAVFPGMCHSACVVVPTALAIAEREKTPINGKQFVTAIAAGYEVSNLIGTALGSKKFASSGFYNSVPTIFGSVTTAAKLLRLNEEQIVRALGLASTQAAGLYSATLAKRLNAPKAVEGGIFAADLALRGLEGPPDPVEAEYSGFVTTFSRTPDLNVISRDLGKYRFEIFHKAYPCIRSNQPTVENVRLMLLENPDITPARITKIVSHVDTLTIEYTMDTTAGGADGVRTPGNALISLPYCVAAMVVDRELTFRQFEPQRIRNPRIQQLMQKIELRADPSIDKLLPIERYRCTTEIHLAGGKVVRRYLPAAKGDPANRMSDEELHSKFMANASAAIKPATARRLFAALESIEKVKDVRTIARLLLAREGA